jgi:hypothetical protein
MDYRDFCTLEEAAIYERIKRLTQRLAATTRVVLADMVGGKLPTNGQKQFITTNRGSFRIAMASNSDNSSERMRHETMGATTVVVGDDRQLAGFLRAHGLDPATAIPECKRRIVAELNSEPPQGTLL